MIEGISLMGNVALWFWIAAIVIYFLALGFIDH